MGCRLRQSDIRRRTEEYWERYKGDYDCYVDQLLGRELSDAQNHPLPNHASRLSRPKWPVHTLVMTVGESFEPLLQVTCVLKPARIVLILNRQYAGSSGLNHGRSLSRLLTRLELAPDLPSEFQPHIAEDDIELVEAREDAPSEVFRALDMALRKPEAKPPEAFVNVVDITGAKKSMVVGAFLYAAHSSLPITYVDFDEFNTHFGKPYGYKCRIGRIDDPYEAFQLRDWEQVRQLYTSYNFRSARELIGQAPSPEGPGSGILKAMSSRLGDHIDGPKLYDQEDIAKVNQLVQTLKLYESWDSGDYWAAKARIVKAKPPLPESFLKNGVPWAVQVLGDFWPHADEEKSADQQARQILEAHLKLKYGDRKPEDSIFHRPKELLAYVKDELAKIGRLVKDQQEYRTAYLRAAGLDEFLLKARLALCWLREEVMADGRTVTRSDKDQWHALFKMMVDTSKARYMRSVLTHHPHQTLQLRESEPRTWLTLAEGTPTLKRYWRNKPLCMDRVRLRRRPVFVQLRGEAIHTHLHIPRSLAKAAYDLVQAGVSDFEANWLEHCHPGTSQEANGALVERAEWSLLCTSHELDFLPPKLRD